MEATECGAACLGMILAHHGRWVPLEALRVKCGVSRDGANAASLMRVAREYGMVAQGYRVSERSGLLELPFPMILFWESCHFVVLEGIKGDRAYINDPNAGPQRISLEEFDDSFVDLCFVFQPGPEFRAGGSPPSLSRALRRRFGRSIAPLSFAAMATLALVLPGIALPAMLAMFIDEVLIGENGSWLAPLLIGLGAVSLIQGALTWMQRTLLIRMEAKLSIIAATGFLWHVVTLPMTFFGQRYAGDIANRVELNRRIAGLLAGELAASLVNVLTMAIYGAVLLAYDVQLTLIAVALVVGNLAILRISHEPRANANRQLLRETAKLAGTSANGIQMIDTVKGSGMEDDFLARWTGIQANALNARQRLGMVEVVAPLATAVFSQLATLAVLGLGGLRVAEGAITVGGLIAFQSLLRSFASPLEAIVRFGAQLQQAKVIVARLDDVLNYKPDPRAVRGLLRPEEEADAPAPRGVLDLDRVTFGYNVADPPLLRELELAIAPGQRVALVGASGSGKSTLAKLICGLLEPWSGSVRIDGRGIHDLSPARFAETVAYVDQEITLFEGTVRDNVAMWDHTISERDIVDALRDSEIHDLFASMPLKYDSRIEEDGRNLSGGQRARLELARALARNPAILVLDEATAALDPVTELAIDDRLRRRGCTCLIVAHRLSTIRDADQILVIERGEIVQRGVHEGLMAEEGPYRTLVKLN